MTEEKMLSVCEIARLLGRSERYVREIQKQKGSPFVSGRAYFSEVVAFLRRTNLKPCRRKKKPAARRKILLSPRGK